MNFTPEELALLAKLKISPEVLEAASKKQRKKVLKKGRKLCTLKRVVREVCCLTCQSKKEECWLLKEKDFTIWQGEQVPCSTFTREQATEVIYHHVATCGQCLRFADNLSEEEAKARLKEYYKQTMGQEVTIINSVLPSTLSIKKEKKVEQSSEDHKPRREETASDADNFFQSLEDEGPSLDPDDGEEWEEDFEDLSPDEERE